MTGRPGGLGPGGWLLGGGAISPAWALATASPARVGARVRFGDCPLGYQRPLQTQADVVVTGFHRLCLVQASCPLGPWNRSAEAPADDRRALVLGGRRAGTPRPPGAGRALISGGATGRRTRPRSRRPGCGDCGKSSGPWPSIPSPPRPVVKGSARLGQARPTAPAQGGTRSAALRRSKGAAPQPSPPRDWPGVPGLGRGGPGTG